MGRSVNPALRAARSAAPTAKRVWRAWLFQRSGGSPSSAIVQSRTSAAIRTGNVRASKMLISATPDRPAVRCRQTLSSSAPRGVTHPSPVITTRRLITYAPWISLRNRHLLSQYDNSRLGIWGKSRCLASVRRREKPAKAARSDRRRTTEPRRTRSIGSRCVFKRHCGGECGRIFSARHGATGRPFPLEFIRPAWQPVARELPFLA